MIVKTFTKKDCPKCPKAKEVIAKLKEKKGGVQYEDYDVETVEGMAEAAFYTVMGTPTVLVCDDSGKEIKSWRGEAPDLEKIWESVR